MNRLEQTQYQFTAHIRDPENQPAPAHIEARRIAIYRDLVFNNINNTLMNAFPVIFAIVTEQEWLDMMRDFLIRHRCKTPLFTEMAAEFITYLEHHAPDHYPFINELAQYEYIELALSIDQHEFESTQLADNVDVLTLPLRLSPLARLLIYRFAVQQICVDNQHSQPAATPVCLLVYRNVNDMVKFIEINPISARLLDLVDNGKTGHQAAHFIVQEMQHNQIDIVINGARDLITDWIHRGIMLIRSQ